MVPSDGGDWTLDIFRREGGAANVGGKSVNRDLVASCVLQTSDAVSGNVEDPREGYVPVCITTGGIDPTEESQRRSARHRSVVGCKGNIGFDASGNSFG